MSVYSTDSGEFTFANRTSTAQFQERLLEAQQLSRNEELEEQLNLNDLSFNNDPEDLKNKLEALKKQVARMEDQVVKYEEQLIKRREKRKLETSLTNMTPEERANYMENEVDEKELPHMDVIFEYLLLVGTATSSNANDLSNTDLLKPSAAIREKAMHDENVLKQTQYSKIRFTEAHNLLEPNPDEPGEIRHCQLKGEVYHERFSITFDVLEPALIMSNIQYDINIEMQLEIGVVLQRIKETSNIMAFFQSLVHYARLTHQRSETFNYMVELYREKEVDVELISESSIEFSNIRMPHIAIRLSWNTKVDCPRYKPLNANVAQHILPDLFMEIIVTEPTLATRMGDIIKEANLNFQSLIVYQGVKRAIITFVDKALTE